MRILNWYVTRGFLLAFGMAILILTFGMTGARLVKALEMISQGVPFISFIEFTWHILPIVLTFTIPWAVMVAVMLVFGRLSADHEITAMRACGICILQIVSPIMLITFLLTLICLYLQVEIGPPLLGRSREIMYEAVIDNPLALFEPGRPFQPEKRDMIISIDDRTGENELRGIQIYLIDKDKQTVMHDISAIRGELEMIREQKQLRVILHDCMIIDKTSEPEQRVFSEKMLFEFDYGKELNSARILERAKHMKLKDLMAYIRIQKSLGKPTTSEEVELNQRIAFALSPIAFLLLGLPLAIRTSRRETSVGLFLSVILAGVFFLSIIICESLTNYPRLYPQFLLWIPNIVFQILGAVMIYRISQR